VEAGAGQHDFDDGGNQVMEARLLILTVILLPQSLAVISFTEGFWSTSFEACGEGDTPAGWGCDGLIVEDNYACDGTLSRIDAQANNPSGEGDGFRIFYKGNERNTMSTPLTLYFQEPQKEFWLKFYYRLPQGQYLSGINEHKIIYAFTDSAVAADVNWGGEYIELQPRNTVGSPDIYYSGSGTGHSAQGGPEGGWSTVYDGDTADGSWHSFEFHLSLGDPAQDNGLFQMWVDGLNYVDDNGLEFYDGGSQMPTGWTKIALPHNHNVWAANGCAPHDVDDIAVALPGFTGFIADQAGRRSIGQMTDDCAHEADDYPCDGCITQDELLAFISKWKSGQETLANLMEAIAQWKSGC
jgi:hypothetical protein